jgi:two-component system, LytTR family, sensor kinase
MELRTPIKKLFRIALYTSPAIGFLVADPQFISLVTPKSGIFKMEPFINPILLFFLVVLVRSIIIFGIWSFNIGLIYLINKYANVKIRGVIRYVISYLFCLILGYGIRLTLEPFINIPTVNESLNIYNIIGFYLIRILILISVNTIILITLDLVFMREKKAMIELENTQLKLKNAEAANQQLKQQIHPHFLFNALNTLNILINKKPGQAGDYLVKLSDFLRVAISLDYINTVKLIEELKLCLNYLEMQKIRFGEALQYTVNIKEDVQNSGFVPVFSLQLLLENAIKHNAFTDETPLSISIIYKEGRVIVSNNIKLKSTSEISTGRGLVNLAERYKIISGDEILIDESNKTFSVSIKVLQNDNSNYRR